MLTLLASSLFATALASPVTLTHQIRLTDDQGEPLNGPVPIEISVWSDDVDTNTTARTWRGAYTPSFADGYATLLLADGLDNSGQPLALDSSHFADDAWIQVNVDGQPLTPRTPVTDSPRAGGGGAAAPTEQRWSFVSGTWDLPQGTTRLANTITYNPTTLRAAVTGWSTRWEPIITFPLVAPGTLPTGSPLEVIVEMEWACTTSDCDPGARLVDGAGNWCRWLMGDGSVFWYYSSVQPTEQSTSINPTRFGVNDLRVTMYPSGEPNDTLVYAGSRNTIGRVRWACPARLDVATGLSLEFLGDHVGEAYSFERLQVTLADPTHP